MIQISLTYALAFYSTVLGILVAAIWIYTELTVRRHHRFLGKQYLWRCVFCGYTYLDESAEQVSQCPRCASYNSVQDKHARFVVTRTATIEAPHDLTAPAAQEPRRNPSHRKRPHQRRRGPRKRSV